MDYKTHPVKCVCTMKLLDLTVYKLFHSVREMLTIIQDDKLSFNIPSSQSSFLWNITVRKNLTGELIRWNL